MLYVLSSKKRTKQKSADDHKIAFCRWSKEEDEAAAEESTNKVFTSFSKIRYKTSSCCENS